MSDSVNLQVRIQIEAELDGDSIQILTDENTIIVHTFKIRTGLNLLRAGSSFVSTQQRFDLLRNLAQHLSSSIQLRVAGRTIAKLDPHKRYAVQRMLGLPPLTVYPLSFIKALL